jgi:hypothetical protein
MNITFANDKLKKYATNVGLANKKLGPKRSKIYQRISTANRYYPRLGLLKYWK